MISALFHFNQFSRHALNVFPEHLAPGRMAQFLERLDLDLPDPFPRQVEEFADLFERMLRADPDAEAHPDDLLLALGQ